MEKRILAEVRGHVQGVGFRMFIYRTALKLGLSGTVRNADNGEVEIDAQGTEGMIAELLKAARTGPPSAEVSSVAVSELAPDPELQQFKVIA
ncbi:MAG TPA: acylphosphatase [Prosthecochloris aestuarii]|uniref:acylphosphatase n=1 Tax=Prosthecochloris aestuarii TaxID=1102 RepID=A0A831SR99_PROAE|nr:acylphosphatase [Prosthecochloris sp.]HED30795.1 acylphosphatase [Prosthecochloris aestuarii]